MAHFTYTLSLFGLAFAFSVLDGPARASVAIVFALHVLSGVLRAAQLRRWWSLSYILACYLFIALLFPKVFCILRGADVGRSWDLALGIVCVANLALWICSWAKGVKVVGAYPPHASFKDYLSFGWLERVDAEHRAIHH